MNQTLYIRAEVWQKFKDEPKKSELVNNLLTDWYDGTIKNPMPQNQKPYQVIKPIKATKPEPHYELEEE